MAGLDDTTWIDHLLFGADPADAWEEEWDQPHIGDAEA